MSSPSRHHQSYPPENKPSAGYQPADDKDCIPTGGPAALDTTRLGLFIDRLGGCRNLSDLLTVGAQEIGRLMAVDECGFVEIQGAARAVSWGNLPLPHWPPGARWAADDLQLEEFLLARDEDRAPFQHSLGGIDTAADAPVFLERLDAAAFLLIPLTVNHKSSGWILLADKSAPRIFSPEDISMGQLVARHMALAIERVQLQRASAQREAELEAVLQAGLSLTASLELQEVLDTILETTMSLIPGSESAHVFVLENQRLRFGAAQWADGRKRGPFAEPREDGLTYTVVHHGELILVPDMHSHPLFTDAPPDWQGSIVGLPLKIRDRVVGVMNVANQRVNAFALSDLRILGMLADQAAIAVENARLHKLVKEQAETDILTGLHNRRALDRHLGLEMQRAVRYQRPITLVMLDLDNFKQVNDRYGHPEGDRVLNEIAQHIQKVVRETDFLARYGGDEFAIVSTEAGTEAGLLLAGRVRKAIASHPIQLPGGEIEYFTVSVGLATYPDDAQSHQTILLMADQALYQAKNAGGGQIVPAANLAALHEPNTDEDQRGEILDS